ncbi:Copia protein, partial [Acromyrmex echinatior]
FGGEAIATANYLRNQCSTRSLKGRTPYEKWRGRTPNVSHLRDFECEVYVLDRTPGKGKLEPRSTKGVFVGYSDTSRAYRVWL